eukprot:gene9536-1712_t
MVSVKPPRSPGLVTAVVCSAIGFLYSIAGVAAHGVSPCLLLCSCARSMPQAVPFVGHRRWLQGGMAETGQVDFGWQSMYFKSGPAKWPPLLAASPRFALTSGTSTGLGDVQDAGNATGVPNLLLALGTARTLCQAAPFHIPCEQFHILCKPVHPEKKKAPLPYSLCSPTCLSWSCYCSTLLVLHPSILPLNFSNC